MVLSVIKASKIFNSFTNHTKPLQANPLLDSSQRNDLKNHSHQLSHQVWVNQLKQQHHFPIL